MKSFIAFALVCLAFGQAHASASDTAPLNRSSGEAGPVTPLVPGSRYERLSQLFATASAPADGALVGWTSGRCYRVESPNKPVGSVLLSFTHSESENEGPAFPGNEITKYMIAQSNAGGAATFDDVSATENADLLNLIETDGRDMTAPVCEDNALVTEMGRDIQYSLRHTGEYFVLQATELGRSRSEVFAYCYFFQKVL